MSHDVNSIPGSEIPSRHDVAHSILYCLNGSAVETLASLCTDNVAIFAPPTLPSEYDDPFNEPDLLTLQEFVRTYHDAFTGICFSLDSVESLDDRMSFRWTARGVFKGPLGEIRGNNKVTDVRGVCRARFKHGKIDELRLATDFYDLLLTTGALCPEPAQFSLDYVITNAVAMEIFERAVAEKKTDVAPPMDEETLVRASLKLYVNESMQSKSIAIVGPNKLSTLLTHLREEFTTLKLSITASESQGATTTFRGRGLAERDGQRFNYITRVGFRSDDSRVLECWMELYSPPTLRELLQ
jgi:hypothetical protein